MSVTKGNCSRTGVICRVAVDLGAWQNFLMQGSARAAERPARSQQLSRQTLTRPGHCQSNRGHLHTYRKHPEEREQPGVLGTGHTSRAWHSSLHRSSQGRAPL